MIALYDDVTNMYDLWDKTEIHRIFRLASFKSSDLIKKLLQETF